MKKRCLFAPLCVEGCFRGQRGLGLILTFVFVQLEGEFAVFPCEQAIRQNSTSELPGGSVVVGCLWSKPVWGFSFLFLHLSIGGKNQGFAYVSGIL